MLPGLITLLLEEEEGQAFILPLLDRLVDLGTTPMTCSPWWERTGHLSRRLCFIAERPHTERKGKRFCFSQHQKNPLHPPCQSGGHLGRQRREKKGGFLISLLLDFHKSCLTISRTRAGDLWHLCYLTATLRCQLLPFGLCSYFRTMRRS